MSEPVLTMGMVGRRLTCLGAFTLLAALSDVGIAAGANRTVFDEMPLVDGARLKARVVCSCVFVQEMSLRQCLSGDDEIYRYPYRSSPNIPEMANQRVSLFIRELVASVEYYRGDTLLAKSHFLNDGGGCFTGSRGRKREPFDTNDSAISSVWSRRSSPNEQLRRADLPTEVDEGVLDRSLEEGFAADGPLEGYTRAVMVVHDGSVVRERYAPGFDGEHRYYLGSTSKVFNNLVAGLLVREGELQLDEQVALPQWSESGDPRNEITFDDLLRMTSGLSWNEEFFVPGAPAYEVYFAGSSGLDVANYVAAKPLEAEPGTHYEYSTGASTLLGYALQRKMGAQERADTLRYLSRELFEPLGAPGIVVEFDAAGTMLTGHSVFARPEDMARVGLLLAQDGWWKGKQLLPSGWIEYSTKFERSDSDEPYGAHLMLDYVVPGCFGHTGVGGQKLIVCPERKLVVVWFASDFDFYEEPIGEEMENLRALQARMIRAFPARQNPPQ